MYVFLPYEVKVGEGGGVPPPPTSTEMGWSWRCPSLMSWRPSPSSLEIISIYIYMLMYLGYGCLDEWMVL